MNDEEKIYWQKIKKREHKAFDALFRLYYPSLVAFAEGFLFDRTMSEDVVQSFFVSVWENSSDIELYGSLRQYCFRAVKNRCLNKLRDHRIRDKFGLLYIETISRQQGDDPELIDPVIIDEVKKCIDNLPAQMSLIFKLKYMERKKNHEISKMLDISENTVKTQLSRARTKLRTMIK